MKKIIVNFRSEIAFFTNETSEIYTLAIYTLINYKHIIPTYVPCICLYCVIAIITVKIAKIIMLNYVVL